MRKDSKDKLEYDSLADDLDKIKTFFRANTRFKVIKISVINCLSDEDRELRLVLEKDK